MLTLEDRRVRTERTLAKFRDRPFSWTGRRTCIHLARAQMVAMGHKPPKMPDLRNALNAAHALKAEGYKDLEALLDSMLPRIAPAAMWIGDLALMPGEAPFDALVLNGGGFVFGYAQEVENFAVIEPIGPQPFKAAWRL